ncbi:hypothetical protein SKA53_06687 [Yoonia vestfoldensis SKA53]|uniref:Uncharacterized protein n=2 Tax=Yoonia vestfoldensis TaxID=245188 RepID=A3V7X0_9RHOB|nr:hypothetical protein SKA53_06687 [Yoonia vestfoldensis SKA53]
MMLEMTKPKMSRPFWVSFFLVYAIGFLALYSILFTPTGWFDTENSIEYIAALKLSTIRTFVISFSMFTFPILLFTSLKWSKYFVISVTAWTLATYIDDYLVLYRIIEYPERGLVALLVAVRPLGVLAMIWMSFELTMKLAVKA